MGKPRREARQKEKYAEGENNSNKGNKGVTGDEEVEGKE